MQCFDFLEGLLGLTREAPPKTTTSARTSLPAELVDEIISFVPPVVQEARYTTPMTRPKGIDVNLFGTYTVKFEGDICVGGKAIVHLSVTDERKDGLTKFPTFDYEWITEVLAICDDGVCLARGDDESSYTIKQKVVWGRLAGSPDCAHFVSSRPEMSKKGLRRSESF
jgi:hypothetical protein